MIIDTEAIILFQRPYSDTASIVNLYTRTHGRITAIVRCRKTQRGRTHQFQPLTAVTTQIEYRNDQLSLLKQHHISLPWQEIPFNPIKSCMAIFLAEIIDHSLHEHEPEPLLYDYFLQSIAYFDRATHYSNFHISLLLSLTQFLGFYPNLTNLTPYARLNLEAGTLSNSATEPQCISYDDTLLWSRFLSATLTEAENITLTRTQRHTLLKQILQYYQLQIADFRPLKSLDIILQLFD